MFISVKATVLMLEQELHYVQTVINLGMGYPAYYEDMRQRIDAKMEHLKYISTDHKLIAKWEHKIEEVFSQI